MSKEMIVKERKQEEIELIKNTVAKGTTDLELRLFLHQAQKTGLDPLSHQIYCVKRYDSKTKKDEMTIQTGIDGYRVIADRTGKYAGNDDYRFNDNKTEFEMIKSEAKTPITATATVYKLINGIRCPFTATARWEEYYPGDLQGFMWKKMPFLMLGKTAEALALRKAFPAELSGVYVKEEMEQANMQIAQATEQETADPVTPDQKLEIANLLLNITKSLLPEEITKIQEAKTKSEAQTYIDWYQKLDRLSPAQAEMIEARILKSRYFQFLTQTQQKDLKQHQTYTKERAQEALQWWLGDDKSASKRVELVILHPEIEKERKEAIKCEVTRNK